jgi:hypothetical protein
MQEMFMNSQSKAKSMPRYCFWPFSHTKAQHFALKSKKIEKPLIIQD